jgi:hypothetical protein
MTDPSTAMQSFQQELLRHKPKLRRGELDKDLYVYVDAPHGEPRFTYVRLEGKIVTAFVELASVAPIEGTTCVALGYAVPEAYRRQGRAKEAVKAALAEMQNGLSRNGISVFYVEAIVGADNKASQRVAEQVISDKPVPMTDEISGLPAFRYLHRFELK